MTSTIATVPLTPPFTILIDRMEKHPFSFTNLIGDSDENYRDLIIKHRWEALGMSNGDYSLDGHQPDSSRNLIPTAARVAIERKSIQDCIGTVLGFSSSKRPGSKEKSNRERFEDELANLQSLESSVVIVEGTLETVIDAVESHGKLSKEQLQKMMFRSLISLQQDFRVPWLFADSRRLAEIYCYRWLERFHRKYSTKDSAKK